MTMSSLMDRVLARLGYVPESRVVEAEERVTEATGRLVVVQAHRDRDRLSWERAEARVAEVEAQLRAAQPVLARERLAAVSARAARLLQ